MHPRILAKQEAEASARLTNAMLRLSEKLGLSEHGPDIASIRYRDGRLQALRRSQAVAEFLEQLERRFQVAGDATTEQAVVERILALDGLTKKSAEVIQRAFSLLDEQDEG